MGKATIDDVARLAAVSIKTVSRVINKEANVREKTRERVLEAINSLNYQPSQSARGLAGNRSYTIGMLYGHLSPGYFMDVQEGVLKTCMDHHYGLILNPISNNSADLERNVYDWLRHSRVEGVVMTPPFGSDERIVNALKAADIPAVTLSERALDIIPSVVIDEVSAARELTRHLIDQGHKNIAFVLGETEHQSSKLRLQGFRDEMKAHGLPVDERLLVSGDFSFEGSSDAASFLMDLSERPTAVFAANDDMAAAVLSAAHNRNIKVPDEVAVVGFDNSPIASQVWPALTTVDQPARSMASLACEKLINQIKKTEEIDHVNGEDTLTTVPYTLHVRASSISG
ncbi:LacI family DNA-binding transcriptional regulator [Kordiimonas sp. SCSIO 12610]|uniref:LacI family DNA-binding transcriptional regulator n=1 Tax=Kordiimonas sp. SCSIO 12610 TaxID=2829597 RepID=UPI00210CA330|nr:LacI family DNA-binding transcriptional regulator [Kordiimonas sp. SCSIO 12610]UTW55846.1 LacI family DNA-binding transcriptional regulator [Kordiimonas sp. SCSIO 12610]